MSMQLREWSLWDLSLSKEWHIVKQVLETLAANKMDVFEL